MDAAMSLQPWQTPEIQDWTQILLDSYEQCLGRSLIPRSGDRLQEAEALFKVPFVVVSHNGAADPLLNYGNQTALDLWELEWSQFCGLPSRLTAEPDERETRSQMLSDALAKGYIDNYSGVRVSSQGRRFRIDRAIIWTLRQPDGQACGQAATFTDWYFLD
ncbi:MEKHLA domain-containing protein [Synechococcus elongatus PCC 11802]|uniref:MEKHLA domain-containing protein n=2 Tax=Synechococcus elongatus TaxID=32046 RepID=A0AAT9JZM8_SYNEL|nr:MEKHLA domain-containing protein [Synechococcus elongatus]QFZ91208.1 MEKHLA domain-containing protein [Synechococcus elongatus PCC 11802]